MGCYNVKILHKAGTYTITVKLKNADTGEVLAEDTAEAVIANAADADVTSYLHKMKNVNIIFKASFESGSGSRSRSIIIDTRDYSGSLVWNGLSFSIQYSRDETHGTISGRFADEKYKLSTLDAVEHEVSSYIEYEDGWPVGSRTWVYDKDILIENLPIEKFTQYGINGLTVTIEGSDLAIFIGTVKFTENEPDDEETDPASFSKVVWGNKDKPPTLTLYFFE